MLPAGVIGWASRRLTWRGSLSSAALKPTTATPSLAAAQNPEPHPGGGVAKSVRIGGCVAAATDSRGARGMAAASAPADIVAFDDSCVGVDLAHSAFAPVWWRADRHLSGDWPRWRMT